MITRLKARDGRYAIAIEDVASPGADDVAVRRVRVRNLSSQALANHHVTFYMQFALTASGLGDRLEYDRVRAALVQRSQKESLALAVGTTSKPAGWQCGLPGVPFGPAEDAASDARDGVLNNSLQSGGKWPGVSGALQVALPEIPPGQEASADFFLAMAPAEDRALAALEAARARGYTQVRLADEVKWRDWLGKATVPTMPGRDEAVYRRALIVMKQLLAGTGAFIASPATLSPAYKYTWLQDSTFAARALLEVGHSEAARQILTFLARVQKPDGDWYVTYNGDGTPFMLWEHGTEFMGGHFVAAAGEYVAATGDLAWAGTQWPAVARACEFMTRQITSSGLLRECRDLWETYSDLSWTYTNGSYHGGLVAGADLARRLGKTDQAREWSAAAGRIRSALLAHAVRDGAFVKGVQLRSLRPDTVIDANVLGLAYPFGVVTPGDPLAGRTLDAIESRLAVPGGGIKRWEGDLWYDSQGWPELTDWAAILRSRRGERDKALAHHGLNTERAWTTGSLQLGEVFDGRNRRWSSAFPLGWAEAKYVLAALELYRPRAQDGIRVRP
ncbi:MAG: glycoside hydrolase family 15 protein [Candidatus Sericytochromatia bacterium]|uniref:Glycoside hydrolase family 15 protein n=1 Tax=Candidatus Tanganyikabacteria bacterium TaxID=2961651 RepID=A0A937X636_9BACT|nr:glycoside hydrolase family 15 protein [Candidatus Tanganyikabacteria bacterium]